MVDWEPPLQAAAKRVHVSFLLADGAHDVHRHLDLSSEPLILDLEEAFQLRPLLGLLETQDLTLQGLEYERLTLTTGILLPATTTTGRLSTP